MKTLLAALLALALAPLAQAAVVNPPYQGSKLSTTTGTVDQYLSGRFHVAAGSATADTQTIGLDGVAGLVSASSFSATYGVTGASASFTGGVNASSLTVTYGISVATAVVSTITVNAGRLEVASGTLVIDGNGATPFQIGVGTLTIKNVAGGIAAFDFGGSSFTVGGSTLNINNGTVGVGISTGGAKFNVNGNSAFRGSFSIMESSQTIWGRSTSAILELNGGASQNGYINIIGNAGTPMLFGVPGTNGGIITGDAAGDADIRGSQINFSRDGGASIGMSLGQDPTLLTSALSIGAGLNGKTPATRLHMSSGTFTIDGNVQLGVNLINGTFKPWPRTMAQINALVPGTVGEYVDCTNCTLPGLCRSTGTAVAQWRKVESSTLGCGTGN